MTSKNDRKFLYSRFSFFNSCVDFNSTLTCVEYMLDGSGLLLGNHRGEVKLINSKTLKEKHTWKCHDSKIWSMKPSLDGRKLITSSTSSLY
eukprot:Pgem_evm1s14603